MAARDTFLAIASHELKTPLSSIQLTAHSLTRTLDKISEEPVTLEALRRKTETINRQVQRISRIVDQLLHASLIASGRLDLHVEPLELDDILSEVAERFQTQSELKGTTITLHTEGDLHGEWDRERLDQMVTHLLSNALNFGRGRPIEVSAGGDRRQVWISVRDFGSGIAPEDQARIFARFERLVSTRHEGGLGLGLWIVRHFAAMHGGSVSVQSRLDRGSTFTIRLPRWQER